MSGIEIDVCPDCLGIYFDKEEISQLVDYKDTKDINSHLIESSIQALFDAFFAECNYEK